MTMFMRFLGGIHLLERMRQIPGKVLQLNLFFNRFKSTEETLSKERWTTRLYLLIWLIVFIILALQNSFAEQTTTINVSEPDEATYVQLYSSYNTSLQCSCSVLAFTYDSFLKLEARLHQICSSSFIEEVWIENIFDDGNWSRIRANEFRSRGVVYFLTLKSVCEMTRRSVNVITLDVAQQQIVKGLLDSPVELFSKINIEIENLKTPVINDYRLLLRIGQAVSQWNQLINIFSSNWIFAPIPATNTNLSYYRLSTQPVSHGLNCSCATTSSCTEPVFVDDQLVPGFVLGCSPMESLLRSSLICLYNATCIESINFNSLSSVQPLDPTITSRYDINSFVDELAAHVLIEEWSLNISYSSYFSACKPALCTYSISTRKTILEIVTMFLGLYGGLTLILRFAARSITRGIARILFLFNQRRNRVIPFI